MDEEYDNDYAENYFDNGEGDDFDGLGDAGGGDEGFGAGGGGAYLLNGSSDRARADIRS